MGFLSRVQTAAPESFQCPTQEQSLSGWCEYEYGNLKLVRGHGRIVPSVILGARCSIFVSLAGEFHGGKERTE